MLTTTEPETATSNPCLKTDPKAPRTIWGFPKILGTLLGVPVIRTIVFWGLYWGPLILGNYHLGLYGRKVGALVRVQKPSGTPCKPHGGQTYKGRPTQPTLLAGSIN